MFSELANKVNSTINDVQNAVAQEVDKELAEVNADIADVQNAVEHGVDTVGQAIDEGIDGGQAAATRGAAEADAAVAESQRRAAESKRRGKEFVDGAIDQGGQIARDAFGAAKDAGDAVVDRVWRTSPEQNARDLKTFVDKVGKEAWEGLGDTIQDARAAIDRGVSEGRKNVEGAIRDGKKTVDEGLNQFADQVRRDAGKALETVKKTAGPIIEQVVERVWNTSPEQNAKDLANAIGKGGKAISDLVGNAVETGKQRLGEAIQGATRFAEEAIRTGKQKLGEGLATMGEKFRAEADRVLTDVRNAATAIGQVVTDRLWNTSPEQNAKDLFNFLGGVSKSIGTQMNKAVDNANKNLGKFLDVAKAGLDQAARAGQQGKQEVEKFARDVKGQADQELAGIRADVESAVKTGIEITGKLWTQSPQKTASDLQKLVGETTTCPPPPPKETLRNVLELVGEVGGSILGAAERGLADAKKNVENELATFLGGAVKGLDRAGMSDVGNRISNIIDQVRAPVEKAVADATSTLTKLAIGPVKDAMELSKRILDGLNELSAQTPRVPPGR